MILIFVSLLTLASSFDPPFNIVMEPDQYLSSSDMDCILQNAPGIVLAVPINDYQPGSFMLTENFISNLEMFYNISCNNDGNQTYKNDLNIMFNIDTTQTTLLVEIVQTLDEIVQDMGFASCTAPSFFFNFLINSTTQVWSSNPQINIAFWKALQMLLSSTSYYDNLKVQVMTEIDSWNNVFGSNFQLGIFNQEFFFCLDYQQNNSPNCNFGGFQNAIPMSVNPVTYCDINFGYIQN